MDKHPTQAEATMFIEYNNTADPQSIEQAYYQFDGFTLCLCRKGSVSFKIDYNEYRLNQNDIFIILPKHILATTSVTPDLEIRALCMTTEFMSELPITPSLDTLKRIGYQPGIQLSAEEMNELDILYAMAKRYREENKTDITKSLIYSLILITLNHYNAIPPINNAPVSRQEVLTHNFFEMLFQQNGTMRNVGFYAEKLCITSKYLTTAVKKTTGQSMQLWINEATIIEAKRFLRNTHLSIQEISERMNFQTSSSFVRFFRQHTGHTPLEYRKKE